VGSKESADRKNEGEVRVELVLIECERKCATDVCLRESRATEIWPVRVTRRIAQKVIINVQDPRL
jgi:hypothetical protein